MRPNAHYKMSPSTFLHDVPPNLFERLCKIIDSGDDQLGWRGLGEALRCFVFIFILFNGRSIVSQTSSSSFNKVDVTTRNAVLTCFFPLCFNLLFSVVFQRVFFTLHFNFCFRCVLTCLFSVVVLTCLFSVVVLTCFFRCSFNVFVFRCSFNVFFFPLCSDSCTNSSDLPGGAARGEARGRGEEPLARPALDLGAAEHHRGGPGPGPGGHGPPLGAAALRPARWTTLRHPHRPTITINPHQQPQAQPRASGSGCAHNFLWPGVSAHGDFCVFRCKFRCDVRGRSAGVTGPRFPGEMRGMGNEGGRVLMTSLSNNQYHGWSYGIMSPLITNPPPLWWRSHFNRRRAAQVQ